MLVPKRIVYVLKTGHSVPRFYVGITSAVRERLAAHNAGRVPHTARHRQWSLHVVIEFADEQVALSFERFLKSGSGRAFAKRHLDDQSGGHHGRDGSAAQGITRRKTRSIVF